MPALAETPTFMKPFRGPYQYQKPGLVCLCVSVTETELMGNKRNSFYMNFMLIYSVSAEDGGRGLFLYYLVTETW